MLFNRSGMSPILLGETAWVILIGTFIFPGLTGNSLVFAVASLLLAALVSLSGVWLSLQNSCAVEYGRGATFIGWVGCCLALTAIFIAALGLWGLFDSV